MGNSRLRLLPVVAAAAILVSFTAGCKHKVAQPVPTPTAQTAPEPTIDIQANSTAIERGQSATLTWKSANATSVELNGSPVAVSGSTQVSPTESTDYQVVAHNAAGQTANASVRVTVTEPVAQAAPAAPQQVDIDQLFQQNVNDAFFALDKADLTAEAQKTLENDAAFLKAHPEVHLVIEAHCDDRGSAEYNMGLGDRRANAARDFLVQQGVDASRIRTVSFGKEKPFCTEDNEQCWQQNRRDHMALAQTGGTSTAGSK